jgi:hypothetical protein
MVVSTNKLQAVNTMLAGIGEAPIAALPATRADGQMAESVLDETTREVLSMGWHFNTEVKTLTRDVNGKVAVPTDYAKIDLYDESLSRIDYEIVVRFDSTGAGAMRLYNKAHNKNTFVLGIDPKCEIVYYQDFEQIPETARRYIMIKAARVFQDRIAGAPTVHQFQMQDEIMALAALRDQEATDSDYTIFDGWAAGRVVMRRNVLNNLNHF